MIKNKINIEISNENINYEKKINNTKNRIFIKISYKIMF